MNAEREQQLDAITREHLGKPFRDCSRTELWELVAELNREADRQAERVRELERIRAYQVFVLDQYGAMIAEGVGQAEQWANGGHTS